jgi:hypothetical protein
MCLVLITQICRGYIWLNSIINKEFVLIVGLSHTLVTQSVSEAAQWHLSPNVPPQALDFLPQIPRTSCLSIQYRNLHHWTDILKLQNWNLYKKRPAQTHTRQFSLPEAMKLTLSLHEATKLALSQQKPSIINCKERPVLCLHYGLLQVQCLLRGADWALSLRVNERGEGITAEERKWVVLRVGGWTKG